MGVEAVIERRRAQRRALIARTRQWAAELEPRLSLRAAVVFGSVARGDFNRWSDVDVLLVSDDFRGNPLERVEALGPRPPLVQPITWTPAEWRAQLARKNPIAIEAVADGVWLAGGAGSAGEMFP